MLNIKKNQDENKLLYLLIMHLIKTSFIKSKLNDNSLIRI